MNTKDSDILIRSPTAFPLLYSREVGGFGCSPSHLLALRLKDCESKAYISAIKSSDDQVTTNPVAINDIFKGFTQICIKPKQILMNQFVSSI